MNEDNLRALIQNIDSDLFELINHVICSICQELLTKPVTTPCGHSFCGGCIKRVVSSKDNSGCPLCKNPIKRYCLENDNVKSTLTDIFRELPVAFEKDVQALSAGLNGLNGLNDTTEDLMKNLKLAQLSSGQDYETNVENNKRNTSLLKKSGKFFEKSGNIETANDSDADSFVPVVKRSENVIEYASAKKKKKMDELVSISQREVESDSGVCDTSELDKKLEQIEKVSPEEKINNWFKAVGSDIYTGSPGTNYIDSPPTENALESPVFPKDAKEGEGTNYIDSPPTENALESPVFPKDAKEGEGTNNDSSMVGRDFRETADPSKENETESNTKAVNDPYEFVPSQNEETEIKGGRKCLEETIPDFKALQSLGEESIKRNAVVLDEEKIDGETENETGNDKSSSELPAVTLAPDVITASQKFDNLLSESKENEKKESVKAHVLYSTSQASSTQFLDCSYHSPVAKVRKVPKRRRSRVSFKRIRRSLSSSKQKSFSNLIRDRTRYPNTRSRTVDREESARAEQKDSLERDETKDIDRQSFFELIGLKSQEALNLEKSVETYLMKFKKGSKSAEGSSNEETTRQTNTKLTELPQEVVSDDVDYENHLTSTLAKLKNRTKAEDKDSEVSFCENTFQKTKTKLMELLEELVNDDVLYKNHPRNTPVKLKNGRKAEDEESEVSFCENTFQQTKTKLIELVGELINDKTEYKNHLRNTPVAVKTQRKEEDGERDAKVTSCGETPRQDKTESTELSEELVNDDVLYANHPRNTPVDVKSRGRAKDDFEGDTEIPSSLDSPHQTSHQNQKTRYDSESSEKEETTKPIDDLKSEKSTQNTHLSGFSTQDELIDEKMFKEMVKNMEKELQLSEGALKCTALEQRNEERDDSALNNSRDNKSPSPDSKLSKSEEANSSFIRFNCLGKIRRNKSCFINFLRLGRLTPTVRRSRSSVVKLVFPIGLSSLARKRFIQDKLSARTYTSRSSLSSSENSLVNESVVPSSRTDHISTGIQTTQKLFSSAEIQTSQTSKSVIVQTTQVMKPSVEIQTVVENCCAGIQTSQMPSPERSKVYKSAEIQTCQLPCESYRPTSERYNPNDQDTEYIPDSVGYDEHEISPKKNSSTYTKDVECSYRKFRSSKARTCSLEKDIKEKSSPSSLAGKNKRKSSSPEKKHFYKHRKISRRKRFEREKDSCSPGSKGPEKMEDGSSQDQLCTSSLIVDSEVKREFEETWVRRSQKCHKDLGGSKNKGNRGEEEAVNSSPTEEKQSSPAYPSQNLSGLIDEVLQKFETRQRIPLNVKTVPSDDDYEMIDLTTPETPKPVSQEQILQVLKNIDLDLKGKGSEKRAGKVGRSSGNAGDSIKVEKSEESDSDFFVEQTPPRPSNSRIVDLESVNSSKLDGRSLCVKKIEKEEDDGREALNSQGTDLIGDSLPKNVPETESFFMVSAPQNVFLTPEKRESDNVSHLEKLGKSGCQSFPKEKSFSTVQKVESFAKANENDQNQLNGASETKQNQLKTRTKAEKSPLVKASLQQQTRQKLCVVASSVKNLDMIKRFVFKFKMEYSNKPIKNMTHLIVGLHESEEEGELLPLCTPKLLFAMANRKWVVSEAWAETCLKTDAIVPEEAFEVLDPAGGHGCRTARLSTQPLFRDCEIYLLGSFQAISKEDFAGLILDCGGTVVQKPEQFSFSPLKLRMIVADQDCLRMDKNQLQELYEEYSTVVMSRDVILMSVQSYKLTNFVPHLLHQTSEEELLRLGYPSQLVKSEEEEEDSNMSNWNDCK